eukprot:CAMPEP_0168699000 /NCGR_PEP_ID=MMETSP0503-20121227/36716_1 /TAXON_ID=89963 /ORGANISM="Heterocapsa rotundata, Strain SCCAP K-0483" /LENGTH=58 /DNA_ID=CAMNT_0008744927 /DNA_START=30 /DNA_END=202 /DNA_ORIENTATION=-
MVLESSSLPRPSSCQPFLLPGGGPVFGAAAGGKAALPSAPLGAAGCFGDACMSFGFAA